MRIVVTGSRGFIGSVFALRAAELGHEVLALDDESRGLNEPLLALGPRPPRRPGDGQLSYARHDCLGGIGEAVGEHWWRSSPRGLVVDAVVHLAAATGSLERPLDELMIYNVEMMRRVYEDAARLGAKAFVWPTTSLALGVPDSPYVISKEEGLKLLRELDRERKISIPVRFFNVAGAYKGLTERRKNEVHLIPTMLDCYLNDRPFVVNGDDYATADGSPSRDFVNVLDVVHALLYWIREHVNDGESWRSRHEQDGAHWLGTGRSTTVRQAIDIFEQYVGRLRIEKGPRRAFDCGGLEIDRDQRNLFVWAAQGGRDIHYGPGIVPPWVSIRDELKALLDWVPKTA